MLLPYLEPGFGKCEVYPAQHRAVQCAVSGHHSDESSVLLCAARKPLAHCSR